MVEEQGYIPGTCNIGKAEIIARRNFAIMMGILSVIAGAAMFYFHVNKLWRLILFLPLASFIIGIQQWYYKFCANFGLRGIFNFGELGKQIPVEMLDMIKADRRKAIQILVTGVILGIVLAVGFYFI